MNLELLKGLTILYVEDEPALRESIRRSLSPFVHEIITAANGVEGLTLYQQHQDRIDLIISDILMPERNGIEMVDAIRAINRDVPVIYTTAFDDPHYLKLAIEQSIESYVLKPIDIEQLFQGIKKALYRIENQRLRDSILEANKTLTDRIQEKTRYLNEKNTELMQQLYTDDLTGLGNRKALTEAIHSAVNPVLIAIDLDGFHTYNELYGEKIGNVILKTVAHTIREASEKFSLTSYRIGADIFALFKDDCPTGFQNLTPKQQKLLDQITNYTVTIPAYSVTLQISATLGTANGQDDLIVHAAMALKNAKQHNIPFRLYDESCNLESQYQIDITWSKTLRRALREQQVVMYHQPILDRNLKIVKYESLMRIEADSRVYNPMEFLDVAKKVKLYSRLTAVAIDSAIMHSQKYGCNIAINLSMEDIENPTAVDAIVQKVAQHGIGHLITFEILESENVHDYEQVIDFIQKVRSLGCHIALDDFGSGYSNFSYLLQIKPDFLKIDGSLIRNITKDSNARIITSSIHNFAHRLGIQTIAEFVHSREVFDLLMEIGIDQFQGFYLGKPEPNPFDTQCTPSGKPA